MKSQTLFAVILTILLTPCLSWSQVSTPPQLIQTQSTHQPTEQAATSSSTSTRGRTGSTSTRRPTPDSEMETRIFVLKYSAADELENLIRNIFGMRPQSVQSDPHSNRLIVRATKEQMEDIEALILKMDSEHLESEPNQNIESYIYRIYMFETAGENPGSKPFSMIIQTSSGTTAKLLENAAKVKIQVSDLQIIDERDDEIRILIQGKAPSKESIHGISDGINNYQIRELRWDDGETFTNNIDAAHHSRLPAQIQEHIQKFLGNDIVTTGYWFGSSSVPGEIEAPIGPWMLHLELEHETGRTLGLRIEVQAPEEIHSFDRQLGHEQSNTILANTIQVKAGKPIIIGYNRQSYGTRRMGAMVIIPEADITGPEDN